MQREVTPRSRQNRVENQRLYSLVLLFQILYLNSGYHLDKFVFIRHFMSIGSNRKWLVDRTMDSIKRQRLTILLLTFLRRYIVCSWFTYVFERSLLCQIHYKNNKNYSSKINQQFAEDSIELVWCHSDWQNFSKNNQGSILTWQHSTVQFARKYSKFTCFGISDCIDFNGYTSIHNNRYYFINWIH